MQESDIDSDLIEQESESDTGSDSNTESGLRSNSEQEYTGENKVNTAEENIQLDISSFELKSQLKLPLKYVI
jgi:hypothetical protein